MEGGREGGREWSGEGEEKTGIRAKKSYQTRSDRVEGNGKKRGGRKKKGKRGCEVDIEVSGELKNNFQVWVLLRRTPHSRHTQIFMTCRCMPLTSSTLIFSFALTSYNSTPIWSANLRASSVWTTFFSGQSFLVPTEVQDVCEGHRIYRHRWGVTYVQGQPVEKTHSYWVLSFPFAIVNHSTWEMLFWPEVSLF